VVLRSRTDVKPLYVSPGHLAEVESSRKLVMRCCLKYRLPEPIRRADLAVQRAVRGASFDKLRTGRAWSRLRIADCEFEIK